MGHGKYPLVTTPDNHTGEPDEVVASGMGLPTDQRLDHLTELVGQLNALVKDLDELVTELLTRGVAAGDES